MPFNLRLTSNERPRLHARAALRTEPLHAGTMREFCQGISFGLGLLVAMLAAYWLISTHVAGFPDLQSLQNYWFAYR